MSDVTIVRDPADTARAARIAHALGGRERGRLTLQPTPGGDLAGIARDLLRALGKRFDVSERPRQTDDLWPLAHTWLVAERIRHLLVLRADRLAPAVWARLYEATRAAGARLWMFAHTNDSVAGVSGLPRGATIEEIPLSELPAPDHDRGDDALCADFPHVPREHFLFFRGACRDLLAEPDFRRADAALRTSRVLVEEWLDKRRWPYRGRPRRPADREVVGLLESVTATCATCDEALTALRAAQIALYLEGLLVDACPHRFMNAHAASRVSPLNPAAAVLLRSYPPPRVAAAGVLALATRRPASALAAINLENVAPGEIELNGWTFAVPGYARALLRAQLHSRQAAGAGEDDPLITGRRAPARRISAQELHGLLGRIARDTGLRFRPERGDPAAWAFDLEWQLQRGITVEQLPVAGRW